MNTHRRRLVNASVALPFSALLDGCASFAPRNTTPNAVVDGKYLGAMGAPVNGTAHYRTLQQALDAAPIDAKSRWTIAIRNGRYYEKVEVTKPNIHLLGESRAATVLNFDAYAGQTKPNASAVWTTAGCASIIVRSTDFSATHLTIENGYDFLANDSIPADDPKRVNDPQAVALMLARGSDRAYFNDVTVNGHQDTLFVDAGRSYFKNCTISGSVDFIFGAAQTVFETCDIVSRPRTKPNLSLIGYITAPSTQISDQYGLVFLRCKLRKESSLVPANSTALGRPWHPAVNMPDGRYADPNATGSSVFIECFMEDHITSEGWFSMTGLQKSGPNRTVFLPEDSRFFEYKSTGPGANINTKRRQLTDAQAAAYTGAKVFKDWHP